ncbi:MAG: HAD family hydrolase, partial [Pseudomonadota bacterium]
DPAMLSWPAGPRESDGVWAPAWYDAVLASTGFGPPPPPFDPAGLSAEHRRLADAAQPLYERLKAHAL